MRNLIIASAVSLSLAGCATVPGRAPVTIGGADPSAIVAQIQAASTAACKFLPTAQSVIGIIGKFTDLSAISPVTTIASAICDAVTATPSKLGRHGTPRVRGVAVRGRFVR